MAKKQVKKPESDARYITRRSKPGLGNGLFATAPIQKGEFILEYTGKRIPTKEADELTTRYLFEIDDQWTIDGSTRSNTARYVNHSCRPNCEARIEKGKILYYATRNIKEGEEIVIDYGDEYFDEFIRPYGCKCGVCNEEFRSQSQPTLSQTPPSRTR